ncbi:hypothetical protein [Candidatus Anaplasma sp. TIGMIC]|uniref:hypothetical protein n=1 Tax=Candidatus Anaplasma sp. TIGMIC TaxID=3020713 RepID=UPI00232DE883|nr:hypothetical protein [Candidatus Anaplasma sp. TIGMIC]MDB1135228.1 hypothetical protein [Candidatus Anaplasma sp. TIGMIC]
MWLLVEEGIVRLLNVGQCREVLGCGMVDTVCAAVRTGVFAKLLKIRCLYV